MKNQTVSVYKTTIKTENNEWSEEQAIYGRDKTHLNGFNRHYYLQFPFVKKDEFESVYESYKILRQHQIEEAACAL